MQHGGREREPLPLAAAHVLGPAPREIGEVVSLEHLVDALPPLTA